MSQFNFKKRYGQNFLKDENIINKIVDSISPASDSLIIEIGPGAGALTKKLKKFNTNLLAFEIDEDTKEYLLPLEDEKTKIIYGDFLKSDLREVLKDIEYKDLYIIGNLPYYITTPIIEHIIDSRLDPKEIIIMVQKEVAKRFQAQPKSREYGYMTVLLSYNFEISQVTDVSKNAFYPSPKVDSTVLKLIRRDKEDIDYEKFKSFLKMAFQYKRKTLKNNLKSYDLIKVEYILKKHGFSLANRAEEVDLNTYIEITKSI